MSHIAEQFRKEFKRTLKTKAAKKNEKYPIDWWKWLIKNKNCKKWFYISFLNDSGQEEQEFFKTRKEMMKVWKEMKPVCYDMRCYRSIMLMIDEESCEEIIDDEIITSYYDRERDEDA